MNNWLSFKSCLEPKTRPIAQLNTFQVVVSRQGILVPAGLRVQLKAVEENLENLGDGLISESLHSL